MKIAAILATAVTAVVSAGAVFWTDGCTTTPPRHWLTTMEVEVRLRENGLKLQSIRADNDRCFAVVARDGQGGLRNVLVNPADGSIVRESAVN